MFKRIKQYFKNRNRLSGYDIDRIRFCAKQMKDSVSCLSLEGYDIIFLDALCNAQGTVQKVIHNGERSNNDGLKRIGVCMEGVLKTISYHRYRCIKNKAYTPLGEKTSIEEQINLLESLIQDLEHAF